MVCWYVRQLHRSQGTMDRLSDSLMLIKEHNKDKAKKEREEENQKQQHMIERVIRKTQAEMMGGGSIVIGDTDYEESNDHIDKDLLDHGDL